MMLPRKKLVMGGPRAKIQDGRHAPDMVTLTFFLWEITSKFFLLAWGLWLLAMQQNYFKHRGRGILVN